MKNTRFLSPRPAVLIFLLAITGSLTGTLAGPRIVAAFNDAPSWLLPAVLVVSVLLALLAAYVAFHLATGNKHRASKGPTGEA